jgi:hypothetical protein
MDRRTRPQQRPEQARPSLRTTEYCRSPAIKSRQVLFCPIRVYICICLCTLIANPTTNIQAGFNGELRVGYVVPLAPPNVTHTPLNVIASKRNIHRPPKLCNEGRDANVHR